MEKHKPTPVEPGTLTAVTLRSVNKAQVATEVGYVVVDGLARPRLDIEYFAEVAHISGQEQAYVIWITPQVFRLLDALMPAYGYLEYRAPKLNCPVSCVNVVEVSRER